MGMMLNRRRVMGKKENPYIQDGLVFWLDGIEKGLNSGKWTDIIGGIVFNNRGALTFDKYFYFSNRGFMESDTPLNAGINYTIECAFSPETSYTGMVFQSASGSPHEGSKTAYLYLNQGLFLNNQKCYTLDKIIGNNTVSLNTSYGMQNGNRVARNNTVDYWEKNGRRFSLGRNGGDRFYYNGRIYAIRIYNRTLSAEEMLFNQHIDNVRFDLGLTI